MASLFRNRYRIESARYAGYDYSSPGKYFITICIKNKIHYFGKIKNGKMILSETGIIALDSWMAIPSHFPHILLDEFIIMPDHIHGIIIIKSDFNPNRIALYRRPIWASQRIKRGNREIQIGNRIQSDQSLINSNGSVQSQQKQMDWI